MAITVIVIEVIKPSVVILQEECESKMMYSLNKEVYELTVQYK